VSGIVTDRKHHYIQKEWPKRAYPRTESCIYYINQHRNSLFTSAAHQIWTQPVFKEKSNYPDFLHIRISGILLHLKNKFPRISDDKIKEGVFRQGIPVVFNYASK
jgi:hypothetical protein